MLKIQFEINGRPMNPNDISDVLERAILKEIEDHLREKIGTIRDPETGEFPINWLQVLGTTETPDIDQGVRHQFHPVVTLLDVLETEEQPLEFVLPRKRPLDSLP